MTYFVSYIVASDPEVQVLFGGVSKTKIGADLIAKSCVEMQPSSIIIPKVFQSEDDDMKSIMVVSKKYFSNLVKSMDEMKK